jgi:predicted ATPase
MNRQQDIIQSDYQIRDRIYESVNSLVYRAILQPNNRPVILKILKENYPTPAELTRYKQEYEVTRALNGNGTIVAYDLQRYENSLVIFLEDFGGESLKLLMRDCQFTIAEFLTIAIKTTTARELQPALAAGLIVPLSNDYTIPLLWERSEIATDTLAISEAFTPKIPQCIPYKFLHDRVQQAAYISISEDEKQTVHLQIGRLLLASITETELSENIFDVVNHFNKGIELIVDRAERDNLAKLNLQAGKKAKASTAYQPALQYLETSLDLLSAHSWEQQYELTLGIYVETLELLRLNTKYDRVQELSVNVLEKVNDPLEKLKIYESILLAHYANFEPKQAIDTALAYLSELGINISSAESASEVGNRIDRAQQSFQLLLKGNDIASLVDLPLMTDPAKLGAIQILQQIGTATSTTNFALYIETILKQVSLSIEYGNAPQAASIYSLYGKIILGIIKDIDTGYEYGKLAIKLQKKSEIIRLEPIVSLEYYGCIWHWKECLRNNIAQEQLTRSYQIGLDAGNNEYAGYLIVSLCLIRFFGGYDLAEIEKGYVEYVKLIAKAKIEYSSFYIKICQKIVVNLVNEAEYPDRLFTDYSRNEEDGCLNKWVETNNGWLLFAAHFCKTISCYLLKDYALAFENAIEGEIYIHSCLSYLPAPQHNFYASLSFLAHYHDCATE